MGQTLADTVLNIDCAPALHARCAPSDLPMLRFTLAEAIRWSTKSDIIVGAILRGVASDFSKQYRDCRLTPELVELREETREGRYCLVLIFQIKKEMTLEMWTSRQSKIQTFFGPGITADIESPEEGRVEVFLTSDGSGAGRGGTAKKDVLPPLVPGAKPRQQN